MKYLKFISFLFLVIVHTFSCSSHKRVSKNSISNEIYIKYLSTVVNDTTFFEIPELKIVDNNIYSILDSTILFSEKCKYFDGRIKNLYSFRLRVTPENDRLSWFIDAHMSPASAIGLQLVEMGIKKRIENIGIFYYKNFLFVVPMRNYKQQKELEYFPFVIQSANKIKIRAPKFLDEKGYKSYVEFIKLNDMYKIIKNEVCGYEILIQ